MYSIEKYLDLVTFCEYNYSHNYCTDVTECNAEVAFGCSEDDNFNHMEDSCENLGKRLGLPEESEHDEMCDFASEHGDCMEHLREINIGD